MEVTLPSGQTATFREPLMRGDIREARRGIVFVTNADGSRRTDGALVDDLTGRVIARMLVSWSLPGPTPGGAQGDHLQQRILDQLDADTYAALETAVGPWVQRILSMNRTSWTFTHDSTGLKVEFLTEEDAQKAVDSGEFTAIEAPGSGPKLTPTVTSSSESLALNGPTPAE